MTDRLLEWRGLCSTTVQLAPHTGYDAYGKPTYGANTSYTARVSWQWQKIVKADGEEAPARGTVILMGNPMVNIDDRLTLSDGSTPPILSVFRVSDEVGELYIKLFIG